MIRDSKSVNNNIIYYFLDDQLVKCTWIYDQKAYMKSNLYRETIFRASDLMAKGEVIILKMETLFEKVLGVFHLSGEVGTIGNLIITNVRVIWYAANCLSNLNIPHLQIVYC